MRDEIVWMDEATEFTPEMWEALLAYIKADAAMKEFAARNQWKFLEHTDAE